MPHTLVALIVSLVVLIAAAPATVLAQSGSRTLCTLDVRKGDFLRLRAGPAASHREVARIPSGSCGISVDEGSCVGRWCIIALGDRKGWANTHYLGIYAMEGSEPATRAR